MPPRYGAVLLRPETRGWVLAFLLAGSAVVVGVLAVAPLTPTSYTGHLPWLAAAFALLAGLAVLVRGSTPGLWAVLAIAVIAGSALLAASQTTPGALLAAAAFTYPVLYAAYAFEQRWLHAMLVLVGVGSAAGLAGSAPGLRPVTWIAATGGVLLAGLVLGHVLRLLRWYATVDPLTGVLTRTAFLAMATSALASARRRGSQTTLVLVDLDGFKAVNDAHGHAAGDALLVRAVEAWRARLRAGDLLGRAGGDEFMVLLADTGLGGARRVLADLVEVSPVGFSAGLARAEGEQSVSDLLRHADAGMYAVKRRRPTADV